MQSPRKPQVVTQSQMDSSAVASMFGDSSCTQSQLSAQARAPLYREPEEIQFKHRPGSAQKNRSQIDFSLPPERPQTGVRSSRYYEQMGHSDFTLPVDKSSIMKPTPRKMDNVS